VYVLVEGVIASVELWGAGVPRLAITLTDGRVLVMKLMGDVRQRMDELKGKQCTMQCTETRWGKEIQRVLEVEVPQ
jgi:hypothetical protein